MADISDYYRVLHSSFGHGDSSHGRLSSMDRDVEPRSGTQHDLRLVIPSVGTFGLSNI